MPAPTTAEVAAKLQAYRKENRITYRVLAEMLETTISVTYDICRAQRVFIPLDVYHRIVELIKED